MTQEPVEGATPIRSKSELGEKWLGMIVSDAQANRINTGDALTMVAAILGTLIAQSAQRPYWAAAMAQCFERALAVAKKISDHTPAPAEPGTPS